MSEKKLLVLTPEQLTIKSGSVPRFEGTISPEDIIGQEAALSLLEPWLTLPKTGESDYERAHDNVLLFGPPETGRLAKVERFARAVAARTENPPPDTVAIPRISDPKHPMILLLPAGSGKLLEAAAQTAFKVTTKVLPIMLSAMLEQATNQVAERSEIILDQMEMRLNEIGFGISETEGKDGMVSVHGPFPIDSEGNPLTEEAIASMSEAEQADLEARREKANEIFQTGYSTVDALQKNTSQEITEKAMRDCASVLHKKMESAVKATGPDPQVIAYVLELQKILVTSAVAKLGGQSSDEMEAVMKKSTTVKVLQDNTGKKHRPVVVAKFPKFAKLFGRIGRERIDDDHVITDHTMIDGGYITEVNGGGTLIVVLDDLLNAPYGSTALNKLIGVVNDGKLRIENIASYLGVESYETNFSPDEIPVNFRLILVCSTQWGMWLRDHPMFRNNFRINIEFDGSMPAELADLTYAKFVALCEDRDSLPKFTPEAIGRLREYGHRLVDSQKRVSTKFGILKDVIAEAGKAARNDGSETTEKKHVWKAIRTQMRRRGNWTRQQRRYEDEILRFTTEGTKVGSINALVVRGGNLPEASRRPRLQGQGRTAPGPAPHRHERTEHQPVHGNPGCLAPRGIRGQG